MGGHADTHEVEQDGKAYAVDTGFIVYNERPYLHFTCLLAELGVATRPSSMSFSVRSERSGLEYNGTSLNTLFAQRRNLLRPAFYRMLADVTRFNREARSLLTGADDAVELGDFLARGQYSREFVDDYLVPMGAAIWSAPPAELLRSSARYVRRPTSAFRHRIRLNTPVEALRRLRTRCWSSRWEAFSTATTARFSPVTAIRRWGCSSMARARSATP